MEAVIAERDRIVDEYTDLIDSDEDRATFQAKLGLARTVFPYVENHNFYVEHWAHSVIWRKMRDLGRVLVAADFFTDVDDVFLLSRHEVSEVLFDYYHGWAVGAPSRGPKYWPREMERRNGIMNALRQWSPPPALGVPPEVITEPFTVMLWGITSDSVRQWLGGAQADGGLSGFAACPGVAEGPARVILSADGIADLREGEVLVAPLTAPSWAPVFGRGSRRRVARPTWAGYQPRRDRVPRVRPARRDRDRVRHQEHQDRPARPGGRQRGHRDHYRLNLESPHAHGRTERGADPGRRGYPHGRPAEALLVPGRLHPGLKEFPVRPARLLGEDFAVFKTPRGRYGMLPEACPHRRASLTYGVVEADGLRCPYHGWLFGTDGTCLDQPAEREETNFRDRVRAVAGQVQDSAA